MPFPTAHPAAVLPLRRYCPRLLNFPALVVGSLAKTTGCARLKPAKAVLRYAVLLSVVVFPAAMVHKILSARPQRLMGLVLIVGMAVAFALLLARRRRLDRA